MQIELMGCTSGGKSTLAGGILRSCQARGIDLVARDDLILKRLRLGWVEGRLARTLLLDIVSLSTCLMTWRKYSELHSLTFRILHGVQAPPFQKLNLMRNTFKKIGIHELIVRWKADQLVLVDEGTLHIAHSLFVHVSAETKVEELAAFIDLIPLPEVIVYVRQTESVLIQRTMARGHNRVPDGSHETVKLFIGRAIAVFERLARSQKLGDRLLAVDRGQLLTGLRDRTVSPALTKASEIVRDGIEAITAG